MGRLWWLIYPVFLLWGITASAKDRPIPMDTVSVEIVVRAIPESHIEEYTRLPEYSYRKSILYETNIFKRYWNSFKRWLSKVLGVTSSSGLDTVLFYLVIILAVTGLIYHLMKSSYNNPWLRRVHGKADESVILLNHDGSGNLLQHKIREYESNGDMRQALRYRFIHAVWKLDHKGVIKWQPDMTNYQVLKMINSPQLKTSFKKLISIYEHIWYGHYPIESRQQYAQFQSQFESFNDKIQLLS